MANCECHNQRGDIPSVTLEVVVYLPTKLGDLFLVNLGYKRLDLAMGKICHHQKRKIRFFGRYLRFAMLCINTIYI